MVVSVHQVVAEHFLRTVFHVIHDLAQEHGRGQHDAPYDIQVRRMLLQLGHDRVDFPVGLFRRLALDQGGQGIEPGNQPGQVLLAPGHVFLLKHVYTAGFTEVPVRQRAAGAAEADLHAVFRIHRNADAECQGDVFPVQDFRGLLQDSGDRVPVHVVIDQEYPFLFPAGECRGHILLREACEHAFLRFRGRHLGQHHHLEMRIREIDPQLGHGPGIMRFAGHQAVEPGIPQRLLVLLQKPRLLALDFAHIL